MSNQKHKLRLSKAILSAELKMQEALNSQSDETIQTLFESFLNAGKTAFHAELQMRYKAGEPICGPSGLRKRLAAVDLGYFARAYLPHYFSRPSPEFHKELDEIWQSQVLHPMNPYTDAKKIVLMDGCKSVTATRGHAKSTNFTFKDSLHAVLYGYKNYIILLSDSYDQAAGFLSSIAEELELNETIQEDFGRLAGKVWREDVIITTTNIKVQAMGAGQKIRGRKHKNWRPDLIVLDDVENDELVRTPEQRKKLYNWFTKAVSKAGDSYTDIVYIGTLLHYDSLLAKVMANPGYKSALYKAVIEFSDSPLWDEWETIYTDLSNPNHEADADTFYEANKEKMLAGTKVLWEEKNSYYALMKMRVEDGTAAFNSELQNEPIDPDNCLFNAEWFDFFNPFEFDFSLPQFQFFGAVDPSLGKSKKSDYSAIITIAKDTKPATCTWSTQMWSVGIRPIIHDSIQKAIWLEKTYKKRYGHSAVKPCSFSGFERAAGKGFGCRRHVFAA